MVADFNVGGWLRGWGGSMESLAETTLFRKMAPLTNHPRSNPESYMVLMEAGGGW